MPSLLSVTALFTVPDEVRTAVLKTPEYELVKQGEQGQKLFIQKVLTTLNHTASNLLIGRIKQVLEECSTYEKLLEFRAHRTLTGEDPVIALSPDVFEKALNEDLPSLSEALTSAALKKISQAWAKAIKTCHKQAENRNAKLDKALQTLQKQLNLSNAQTLFLIDHFVTTYPTLDTAANAFCSFVDSIPLKTKTLARLMDYVQQATPNPQTLSQKDRTLLVNLAHNLPLLEKILPLLPPAQNQFLKACLQSNLVIFKFKKHLDLMFTHPNYTVPQMTKQMQTRFNKPGSVELFKLSNGTTFPLYNKCKIDIRRQKGKIELVTHTGTVENRLILKQITSETGVQTDDFGIQLQKLRAHHPQFDGRLNYLLQTLISQEGFVPTHQTLAGSSVESPYMAEQKAMHTEIHEDSPNQIRVVYTRTEGLVSMDDVSPDNVRKGFATASYRFGYTLTKNGFGNWSFSVTPFVQESFVFNPATDECFRARHHENTLSQIGIV